MKPRVGVWVWVWGMVAATLIILGSSLALAGAEDGTIDTSETTVADGGSYKVFWSAPALGLSLFEPVTVLNKSWSSGPHSRGWRIFRENPKWVGDVAEAFEWATSMWPCGNLTGYTFKFDSSITAKIEAAASCLLRVNPPQVNAGEVYAQSEYSPEAYPSPSTAVLGETVTLRSHPNGSHVVGMTEGFVTAGSIQLAGKLHGSVEANLLGVAREFKFGGDYDYTIEGTEGPKEWEIAGSGIFVGIDSDFDLVPRSHGNLVCDDERDLFSFKVDLDKLALVLVGKYSKRKANDKSLPKSKRDEHAKIAKITENWLKVADDGLGAKLEQGPAELEVHLLDLELQFAAAVKRCAKLDVHPARTTFRFSQPVLVDGKLASEVEYTDVSGAKPARIGIPRTCQTDTIVVTPTIEVLKDISNGIYLIPDTTLTGEAGVVSAHVDKFRVCGPLELCVPWPRRCGTITTPRICTCWSPWSGWGCCWNPPDLPLYCPTKITFPEFDIPDIDLGRKRLAGVTPFSDSRPITLRWHKLSVRDVLELEPFDINVQLPEPLTYVSISSTGKGGSDRHESYTGPGDTVTVEFSTTHIGHPVATRINGREAAFECSCYEDCADGFTCTAWRELDTDDPDGPVAFEIEYRGMGPEWKLVPGYVYKTTDGSQVIHVNRPPGAPTGLKPSGAINIDSSSPTYGWNTMYDSAGFEAHRYELRYMIDTPNGPTQTSSYTVIGTNESTQVFVLPEPLRNDSTVTWTVRAASRNGRWGETSEEGRFCYYPPAQFEFVHIESDNLTNLAYAVNGDIVRLEFRVDTIVGEALVSLGGVSGLADPTIERSGSEWTVTQTVDTDGATGPVSFWIGYSKVLPDGFSGSGVYSECSSTTDGSGVCVLRSSPPPAPRLFRLDDGALISCWADTSLSWEPTYWPDGCDIPQHFVLKLMVDPPGTGYDKGSEPPPGELPKEEPVAHTIMGETGFEIPAESFPCGSTIEWQVCACDPLGRCGPFTEPRT
ncbi:hypothetical protein ACFLTM_05130, partial [Candidatus Bipolaricaulota bacterium]